MVLTRRQRFVLKLRIRYKFKRIYLTLLVPAIIALVIMSYTIYTGYAPVPNLGPKAEYTAPSRGRARPTSGLRIPLRQLLAGRSPQDNGPAQPPQLRPRPRHCPARRPRSLLVRRHAQGKAAPEVRGRLHRLSLRALRACPGRDRPGEGDQHPRGGERRDDN